jgi:uncharacterized membrane protein YfcA
MIIKKYMPNICSHRNIAIITFIIITLIATFAVFKMDNYQHPFKELLTLIYVITCGIISLIYYFKTKNLHRTAILIILLFGILFVFISPINAISDEQEHLIRG